MDAVHNPDQPLTSVEFNCGDGNFGDNLGSRYDVSAADFKTRMCIAQGNRLLNYYLLTGGRNYRLDKRVGDGNDRIASTGERHGFAAPVSPEGELNYTFPRMARAIKTMMAVSDKIASMDEERDDVSFAFIPDYYMTEYHYPHSVKMREILSNIEANRNRGAWEIMGKSMLLSGYRFGSVDVQNKPLTVSETPVLALPSARYMDSEIQRKLVDYMYEGGGIFLYGEVPQFDMEGKECTILADAFGVKPKGIYRDSHRHFLSLYADNWAAPRPEVRTHFAQTFEIGEAVPLLRVYKNDEATAFDVKVGKGRAIVMATAYSCDIALFKEGFEKLGAKAKLTHDCKEHGIFMTSTSNHEGERFIHILNLDGFDKELKIYENGEPLFGGKSITLQSKDGVMLPVNLLIDEGKILYSTAEITKFTEKAIQFRLTQSQDVIAFETTKEIAPNENYSIVRLGELTLVNSHKHAKVDDALTIYFK
jgi:beta-galactosidase